MRPLGTAPVCADGLDRRLVSTLSFWIWSEGEHRKMLPWKLKMKKGPDDPGPSKIKTRYWLDLTNSRVGHWTQAECFELSLHSQAHTLSLFQLHCIRKVSHVPKLPRGAHVTQLWKRNPDQFPMTEPSESDHAQKATRGLLQYFYPAVLRHAPLNQLDIQSMRDVEQCPSLTRRSYCRHLDYFFRDLLSLT